MRPLYAIRLSYALIFFFSTYRRMLNFYRNSRKYVQRAPLRHFMRSSQKNDLIYNKSRTLVVRLRTDRDSGIAHVWKTRSESKIRRSQGRITLTVHLLRMTKKSRYENSFDNFFCFFLLVPNEIFLFRTLRMLSH